MANEKMDMYALRRVRTGKTAKDKANGAHKNRLANRAARDEWCQNSKALNTQHPSNKGK